MWTRKELKDKAKISFRANYWKAVLVALIMVAIGVWASGPSGLTASIPSGNPTPTVSSYSPDDVNVDVSDGQISIDVDGKDGDAVHVHLDPEHMDDADVDELIDDITHDGSAFHSIDATVPGLILAGLSIGMIFIVIIALGLAVYAFVFNPLEIGCVRFFVRNLNQRAEVKEIAFAYDNNYLESVKTLFLRDLFIILWSLLLIIPGIYKAYEYRMIPYLMADDPTMTKDRAFAESKRMMDGQKWNAFVLDLSFLGWNILSALTLGILGVFYVDPYQAQTNAALYEKLRYGLPAPEQAAQPTQPWQMPYGATPVQPTQAAQATPFAPAAAQAAQPMQDVPVATVTTESAEAAQTAQALQTAPIEVAPNADAQAAAAPVIAPAAQPPIPPFAAIGYEPDDELEEEAGSENLPAEPESSDSPEA